MINSVAGAIATFLHLSFKKNTKSLTHFVNQKIENIQGNQVLSETYCRQQDIDIGQILLDIGEIVSKSDSRDITFDGNLRISLLDIHFKPDHNSEFPQKLFHDCKRLFSHNWIMK